MMKNDFENFCDSWAEIFNILRVRVKIAFFIIYVYGKNNLATRTRFIAQSNNILKLVIY